MAILHGQFHHNDPIGAAEIDALHTFLQQQLSPLSRALTQHAISDLVGTKGTFDVLVAQFSKEKLGPHCAVLPVAELPAFFERVIQATKAERLAMPEIPDDRIDMIVVGMLLIRFVLKMTGVPRLLVSDYDVKEGVLAEMAGFSENLQKNQRH